jgi:hypothetical protein
VRGNLWAREALKKKKSIRDAPQDHPCSECTHCRGPP